ncbi:YjjG family noncanonical pyrimidine nucleotidase [Erysipelothrix aquatica]|uniref:YjjG family noncanonical pyrimidine nucleotidase n=1 Tax=Erysipelothrix aquatica TaxID=2683714 RepID=UPI00135B2AAB|nr:YjjG family noncanonical pyrimidine nucleotidase [Erysipelothrix aquatica]
MKYKTILLDIDNTLLDFTASQDIAFGKLLNDLGIPYSDALKEKYLTINHQLWHDHEAGHIPKETIMEQRFARSFEDYEVNMSGYEMDDKFRQHVENHPILMPNAKELLAKITDKYTLAIVTNGISRTQHKRLHNVGIHDIFEAIVISSDVGATKPSPVFFDYTFKQLPHADKTTTLIIGDSLSADIQGGNRAGITTVWYNPKQIENTSNIIPDYEITDLMELLSIVE